jgi:hypothetical protein
MIVAAIQLSDRAGRMLEARQYFLIVDDLALKRELRQSGAMGPPVLSKKMSLLSEHTSSIAAAPVSRQFIIA